MPLIPASLPLPPGARTVGRAARRSVQVGVDLTTGLAALAAALPSIATSLERLANLEEELAALASLQDELRTLGRLEDELETIAKFGTPLDRLTEPVMALAHAARTLPELTAAAQSLPALVEMVGDVEGIVLRMDARLEHLTPVLDQLAEFGDELEDLSDAMTPIGRLAGILPGSRRKRREAPSAQLPAADADEPQT